MYIDEKQHNLGYLSNATVIEDRPLSLTPLPIPKTGMLLEQVGTPALLLDLDAFESNLQSMAKLAQGHHVALRPHAKAHKSVAIANVQMGHGAIGICCQKLSEAYPFAAAGIKNILISNQFVGADKVAMAIELAKHVNLSVCVDHPVQIKSLGLAAEEARVRITVLPEVDIGQGRCGVTNPDDLMALIDCITQYGALHFGGIQAYHGGAQHIASWHERKEAAQRAADTAAAYVGHLDVRGIRCKTVTGSGTGTAEFDAASGVYTELQPGSYAFMDRHYGSLEWQGKLQLQHSLFIASTIMSTAHQGRAVCDVGLKGLSVDSGMPAVHATGGTPSLHYIAANDEHGILEIKEGSIHDRLGDRIMLIPGHCDPTVNLYSQLVGFRKDVVECIWDIDARGLSQ
jgi:D-threonine aldolase